jgi:3-oxoacyl-(acyl-carrier-protein) synthase
MLVPVTVDLIFGVVLMPCVSVLLNIIIPEQGTRPMSASGFVPGSGAGAFVLEDLETALSRGVRIYAEVLGGNINSGTRNNDGSKSDSSSKMHNKRNGQCWNPSR